MIPIITDRPRHLQGQHHKIDFGSSDIQRFATPTAWLNDVCINDGVAILQLYFSGPLSDSITIISTLALPTLEDDALWRTVRCSIYWEKPLWLVPIHRTAPYEHWVLGIVDFTRQEITSP